MDEDNIGTYSDLCRLCLKEPGVEDLFETTDLLQDVYLCTGVKVKKSNNLPRKICVKCLEIVRNAKKLRIMVKENETHMKIFFDIDIQQVDEANYEDESSSTSIKANSRSSVEDRIGADNQEDTKKVVKRERSSSSENQQPQKIFVRKDLHTPSSRMSLPGIEGTYTEGTKYGISKTHATNKLGEMDVSYTCAMCPKTFPTWKKVYCHQRTHNKNIECSIKNCGKKFATKGDLEKHIRIHTGERPYKCNKCDMSFSQRCTLRIHLDTVHQLDSDSETLVIC